MEGKKPKTKYIIVTNDGEYNIFPKMYDSIEEAERMKPKIMRYFNVNESEIIKIEVTI